MSQAVSVYTQGTGTASIEPTLVLDNPPTASLIGPPYKLGQIAVVPSLSTAYILNGFAVSNGIVSAEWTQMNSSGGSGIDTLTTDTGLVSPVAGNVTIHGNPSQGITTAQDGPGAMQVSATDATTTQIGVLRLATNAEAIAGVNSTAAVVPSSLAAAQTAEFASPPPLGNVTPNAVFSTTLNASGLITGQASATINTAGTALNLGTDNDGAAVNIGHGNVGRNIIIGGTNADSIDVGNAGPGTVVRVGNNNGATIVIEGGAGITIDGGATGAITIGDTVGTGTITVGNSSGGSQTIQLGSGTSTYTISLGASGTNNIITLGNSSGSTGVAIFSGSGGLNIASGGGTLTINSGTGATNISTMAGAASINVATGAGNKTLTLGSTNTGSTTTVQAGTGGITLAAAVTANVGINILTGDLSVTDGNINFFNLGKKLLFPEGSNASMGVATLVAGTVTVATTAVTGNSRIFLTIQSLGTVIVPTTVAITTIAPGASFTITSADPTDTSDIAWLIVDHT
jgi:hypothetical protein